MNNDSKTNLLKILLNEPNETPTANTGEYVDRYTNDSFTSANTALTEDQLQFQGYTIGLCGDIGSHGGRVLLFDSEGNKLLEKRPIYKGIEVSVTALDIDENGDVYGIAVYDNKLVLLYLNNIFVPDAEGNYDVVIKKSYPLQDAFQEIWNEYGASSTMFVTDIKKSPYGSQFLISMAYSTFGNSNYSLVTILYNVNVGADNTWDYRLVHLNDYPADYCWIKCIKPTWTNDSCSFTMFLESRPLSWSTLISKFYRTTGDFNEGSTTSTSLFFEQSNIVPTDYGYAGTYASKNAVIRYSERQEVDEIFFVAGVKTDTTSVDLRFYRYRPSPYNTTDLLWHIEAAYTDNPNCNNIGMTQINNEIFVWIEALNAATSYNDLWFAHYVLLSNGTIMNEVQLGYSTLQTSGEVLLIQNYFNLYKIITNAGSVGFFASYIYNRDNYNSSPVFTDKSVTPRHLRLIGPNSRICFDRNLYNKTQSGNSVNSVTQIPFNYLNDTLVTKERLISEMNNVITEDSEEITKNIYEELYITNIDTFKVWDRNNGSTYNQDSSIEVAKNVKDGFIEEYKIKKYKINYKNGTSQVGNVSYTRTERIAEITLAVYNTGIDNIQIFDDSLSIPFITIDLASYQTDKLYLIKQKVKVE